ncbi:MAG: hypothetical protein LBQ27_03980 [Clostridiales bacterium]|jgi:hypothetical protein|nr:hypothetical protein [Clostridiales bacterium]
MEDSSYFTIDTAADMAELEEIYRKKRDELSQKIFLRGSEGETAAYEISMLEEKYCEAVNRIRNENFTDGNAEITELVNQAIKTNDTEKLQAYLDTIITKNAYWHYIQSLVYYIKKLYFDSLNHLRTAVVTDNANKKYQRALFKLEEKILLKNEEK